MRVKAFALALFGVLLFLSACKKPSPTEGGDYFPSSDELTALQTDTFSIVATTLKEDSVFTDELSLALVGMIDNPTFGTTQCVTYTVEIISFGTRCFLSNGRRLSHFIIGL